LFEISTTGKPTTETNDLIDEANRCFWRIDYKSER
jgi:hypothetical protein